FTNLVSAPNAGEQQTPGQAAAQIRAPVPTVRKRGHCPGASARAHSADSRIRSINVLHEKVPGKYRCEQCDRAFNDSGLLNKHRRTHTGERPYACTECAMKFMQKNHLQEHFRRKHTEERSFACDKCEKRFSTKQGAQRHHSAHTFSKPFMCDVDGCEKRFTVKGNVLVHKRTVHEKVRKYRCEHCDHTFAGLTGLKQHRRLHTGERPYVCTECEITFARREYARKHLKFEKHRRTHTGERPHACTECAMKFIQKSDLNKHIRTHTGERPFACTECVMKFTQKAHLQFHHRAKHQA
ncbi:unnamed protein product, partial [Sphagnum balticum]